MAESDHPLRPIVTAWVKKIHQAHRFKKDTFQDDADEAMRFFNGPYDFLYGLKGGKHSSGFTYGGGGDDGDMPRPTFCMTVNKVAEMVQLFGPALYHRNPVRQVSPRKPPMLPIEAFGDPNDPNTQLIFQQLNLQVMAERSRDSARAALLEHYLNYTPNALDLKTESRWAIDEAIIKGMGLLWSELYYPAGATMKMVGSFYDSCDNLLMDPDAEVLRECKWVAKRCVHPYWQVEADYGLPPDSLKQSSGLESYNQQSEVTASADGDYRRKQGVTNDLVVYWKVFSKMGVGGRLSGVLPDLKPLLEPYGEFIYLVVCEKCPYPLNLPQPLISAAFDQDPQMQQQAVSEMKSRLQWPTPYWADDAWPFTPIEFHSVPRRLWPMSHVSPGMGELKFLNWAFSFLAGKVRTACRDFLAVAKSAGEELKERIRTGPDYTMIEVESIHDSIDKVVKFLQHPDFNPEIYKVIEAVSANFERRTGLTELMYGLSPKQMRSAEEAQIKGDQISVRPDDMANKVEDAMSEIARKEALAARWHIVGQDVIPVMGQLGAQWWDNLLSVSDPQEVLHQLEYRIEAGSAKKPNKSADQANMQQAMQTLFPTLWQYATLTGNIQPVNNLIAAWAKSIDLDPTGFLLPAPPPPPAPTGPADKGEEGGGPPGQQGGPPGQGGPPQQKPSPPPPSKGA